MLKRLLSSAFKMLLVLKQFASQVVDYIFNNILIITTLFLCVHLKADTIILRQDLSILERQNAYLSLQVDVLGNYMDNIEKQILAGIKRDVSTMTALNDLSGALLNTIKTESDNLKQYVSDYYIITQLGIKYTELKLLAINVFIYNPDRHCLGSGSVLKYNGNFYILSARHLINDVKDNLVIVEDGKKIKLKIIKEDKKQDLMLLQTAEPVEFEYYTELSKYPVMPSDKVYIVGNPMGLEDTLSDGRVINIKKEYMYVHGYAYFGSSGGGVYNQAGDLVGVLVAMYSEDPTPKYCIGARHPIGVVMLVKHLGTIQEFLKDIR